MLKFQDFAGGKTLLHQYAIADNPRTASILSKVVLSSDLLDLLDMKDRSGNTPLHYAIKEKSMRWIRAIIKTKKIKDEDKLSLLKTLNREDHSPLQLSLEDANVYKELIEAFQLQARGSVFEASISEETRATPLHMFAESQSEASILRLLELLDPAKRKEYLMKTNYLKKTAIHLVAEKRKSGYLLLINDLLDLLANPDDTQFDSESKLAVLEITDNSKRTVFHNIAMKKEGQAHVLSDLLDSVQGLGSKRLKKLLEKADDHGKTVFHYAAEPVIYDERDKHMSKEEVRYKNKQNSKELLALSRALACDDLTDILRIQDESKKTALHYAVDSCLDAVIHLTEQEDKSAKVPWSLIKEVDGNGDTVFHIAAENQALDIIEYFLQKFPADSKALVRDSRNKNSETILHKCGWNDKLYETILSILSPGERLKLVKAQDTKGNTVLHQLAITAQEKGKSVACYDSCRSSMLFLLQSLNGTSEINTILNEIRNKLGGTVLEYLFDIQEDCFDVL